MTTLAGFKGGFAGEHRCAPTEQEIWDAAYQAGLAAARGAEKETAIERFTECCGAELETPLDQLKFFCSGAMNGQDWLDSEPFFDAVEAQRSQSTPVPAQDARLAELEARHATDDDLWHIAGVVTGLSGGSLFNVSQHECVTAIRASFMDPDSGRALLAAALKQPAKKAAAIDGAQEDPCTLCGGGGTLDGTPATCPNCDRTGIEPDFMLSRAVNKAAKTVYLGAAHPTPAAMEPAQGARHASTTNSVDGQKMENVDDKSEQVKLCGSCHTWGECGSSGKCRHGYFV